MEVPAAASRRSGSRDEAGWSQGVIIGAIAVAVGLAIVVFAFSTVVVGHSQADDALRRRNGSGPAASDC